MRLVTFSGPTISPDELRRRYGDRVLLEARAPVRHGDVLSLGLGTGDAVLVIDGSFHQARAVRHKELLHLIDVGVSVHGCSSLGAIRAAELAPFGMIGHGSVFAAYRDGTIDADDEVAVAQRSHVDLQPASIPLVRVRQWLAIAVADSGILTADQAEVLLKAARDIYYPQRNLSSLTASWAPFDPQRTVAAWLRDKLDRDATFGDVKLEDAETAMDAILGGEAGRDAPCRDPGTTWRTPLLRAWINSFTPVSEESAYRDRILYQQIFSEHFASRWLEFLDERSRDSLTQDGSATLDDRLRLVLPDIETPEASWACELWSWPMPTEPPSGDVLLADETRADRDHLTRLQAVWKWALEAEDTYGPLLSESQVESALALLWNVSPLELGAEARARGFATREECVGATPRLLLGHLFEQFQHARGEIS